MAVYYMDGLHEIFQDSLYHHGQVVGQSNLGSWFAFLLHIVECRCPKASTLTMHHQLKIKSKVRSWSLARVLWLEIEWDRVHHQGISRFSIFHLLELEMY